MRPDVLVVVYLIAYACAIVLSKILFPYHSWLLYIIAIPVFLLFLGSLYWLLMRFLSFAHTNPVEDSASRYRIIGSVLLGIALLILTFGLLSATTSN